MLEGFLVLGVHGEVIVQVQNLHGLVSQHSWEANLTYLGITSFPPWNSWETFGRVHAWVVSNETRKIIRVSAEFVKVEKPSNC